MELTGQKKVHIVPMGFEIDRIEIPLRDIGADRVYLITDLNSSYHHQSPFFMQSQ